MIPDRLSEPHLVIGEAHADAESIFRLTSARGIGGYQVGYPEPPMPRGRTGFGDLLAALPVDRDLVNVKAVVIAYDNNGDPVRAFQHIQQEIRRAQSNYAVPNAPLEIAPAVAGIPAIVALPIPWVGEVGCLESLILPSISDKWAGIRVSAETLIAASPNNNLTGCKRDKAILAAMVACVCTDPTCSVGSMWWKDEFKSLLNHGSFDRVANFFRDLPGRL